MIPRVILLALSWGTLSIVPLQSNNLPLQQLPVYGGSGGTAFTRSCGAGKVLTGLRFRGGALLDAVGLLCRPVNSNGTLGSETTVGTLAGGGGGTSGSVNCLSGDVLTDVTIRHGSFVNHVVIYCKRWDPKSRTFGGPIKYAGVAGGTNGTENTEQCEAPTQPAKGIRGRAASVVDAIGFTCDEP